MNFYLLSFFFSTFYSFKLLIYSVCLEMNALVMNLFLKDYPRKYFWEDFRGFNRWKRVRETVGSYLKEKYWDFSEKKWELRCMWDLARAGWASRIKTRKLCLYFILFRYFIFTSFWAYKIYYVYGFMMLVLVILCIVTVCVTIVCTYFLLNAEDYRW